MPVLSGRPSPVLFATHDHSLIAKRDHRIIGIDEGRVVEARTGLRSWPGAEERAASDPASGLHAVAG